MLTSPRTVREISRSSLLDKQGHLTAVPTRSLEKSRVEIADTSPCLLALEKLPTWLDFLLHLGLFTS